MLDNLSEPASALRLMSDSPLVAGAPPESSERWVTPNDQYFIRNHFSTPTLDTADWSLQVDGAVDRELNLNYSEVRRIDNRTIHALLECAGNSRSSVQPPIEGLLWDHGAVGNASWRGVPVREILARAGIKDTAVEAPVGG